VSEVFAEGFHPILRVLVKLQRVALTELLAIACQSYIHQITRDSFLDEDNFPIVKTHSLPFVSHLFDANLLNDFFASTHSDNALVPGVGLQTIPAESVGISH
jgi:hypothetical protein